MATLSREGGVKCDQRSAGMEGRRAMAKHTRNMPTPVPQRYCRARLAACPHRPLRNPRNRTPSSLSPLSLMSHVSCVSSPLLSASPLSRSAYQRLFSCCLLEPEMKPSSFCFVAFRAVGSTHLEDKRSLVKDGCMPTMPAW